MTREPRPQSSLLCATTSAMVEADESYAGSETFTRLEAKVQDIFGTRYFLPTHQGRACEHILAQVYVRSGSIVPTNYHFATTKAHIVRNGGTVEELFIDEALEIQSTHPFKGNMDVAKLEELIRSHGRESIAFVRVEAGANLIGGQPMSLENLQDVRRVCDAHHLLLVLDASLLADNLYFIKQREASCRDLTLRAITRALADLCHIIYFSARKLGCARGGGLCTSDESIYLQLRDYIPLFEGFLTYGGMSVREMEALAVGLEETMDDNMVNQGPQFTAYMVEELQRLGVPVVTPPGGLGCHVDAREFLAYLPQEQYPAGALAAAYYLVSGVRGMERGTLSEQRDADGRETLAHMELLRLAMPRRVFTLSQVKYAIDRLVWLHQRRELVGGLRFIDEPKVLRFFFGRLEPVSPWQQELVAAFRRDFGDSL